MVSINQGPLNEAHKSTRNGRTPQNAKNTRRICATHKNKQHMTLRTVQPSIRPAHVGSARHMNKQYTIIRGRPTQTDTTVRRPTRIDNESHPSRKAQPWTKEAPAENRLSQRSDNIVGPLTSVNRAPPQNAQTHPTYALLFGRPLHEAHKHPVPHIPPTQGKTLINTRHVANTAETPAA